MASPNDFGPETELSVSDLSDEQNEVVRLIVEEGKNVFLTGCAGTGKSHVVKRVISLLEAAKVKVAVVAFTGTAAQNIGGITANSFFAAGLADKPAEFYIDNITSGENPRAEERIKKTNTLVFDEVSMLGPATFVKFDKIARAVREVPDLAFGGMQLFFIADFLQLPPVPSKEDKDMGFVYAFETPLWSQCFDNLVELHQVFRQRDQVLVTVLNNLRRGELDRDDLDVLKTRVDADLDTSDGIPPTRLFSTNAEVDRINQSELAKLTGEPHEFDMIVSQQGMSASQAEAIAKKSLIPRSRVLEKITLKYGAIVMMRINDNVRGLVNGSTGVVVGFTCPKPAKDSLLERQLLQDPEKYARWKAQTVEPIVKFDTGQRITVGRFSWNHTDETSYRSVTMKQIPLSLAWAMTFHKSQGATIKKLEISLRSIFTYAMAYVGLSRVSSLEGLCIIDWSDKVFNADKRALDFHRGIETKAYVRKVPKGFISHYFSKRPAEESEEERAPQKKHKPSGEKDEVVDLS